ncbi:MAG: hypothetical protein KJI69_04285 [Patescibacteria group bacterium]|nr:hypothetical protein [Patescibacteria group bacterium]
MSKLIGTIIIFVGILVFFSGINTAIQFEILGQIPIIGGLITMIASDDIQTAMLHVLLGLVLIFFGVLLVRRKKN